MSISVAIVIPAYREGSYIEKTLVSIEKSVQYSIEKNWIPRVIVVANNPTSISDSFRKDNQRMIQQLNDLQSDLSFPLDVLDYTEPGIQNGVGEARRIGMSYAISKYLTDPNDIIVSLDADCDVDLNYVATLFQLKPKNTFTFYFEHHLDSSSMTFYELYLRYLRWGHVWAESPFSHYSVGSSLGTTVENYNKSGGMPSKSATEDFHFLNKLRKIGPIDYITSTTVHPSTRFSERVTLGTGYFLTNAKAGFNRAFSKLMVPHPTHFETLKTTLRLIREFNGQKNLRESFEQEKISDVYKDLYDRCVIEKIYAIFDTTTQPTIYQNRLMEVFDGLETLRLLRTLWTKQAQDISTDVFMKWANQLWGTQIESPDELLKTVRQMEKVPKGAWHL